MNQNFNSSLNTKYEINNLQKKFQDLKRNNIGVINCTIGDPKDETPTKVVSSLIESIKLQKNSQYPQHIGGIELREAIECSLNNEYNINLDKNENILSCNGTKEAIFSIQNLFNWNNGKKILIPSLSYPIYQLSAVYNHIPYEYIQLKESNKFLPDLNSLDTKTLNNTQIFWINSPHNPTTTIASREYLEKLIELAEKHNFIVCSDECYNDLYYDQKPYSVMSIDSEFWICFRSLSKRSHMTGYRSGAIISKNKQIINHLKTVRAAMGVGTPSFIQAAAITAWKDNQHVIDHRKAYKRKRDKLISTLNKKDMRIFGANAAFYLWVRNDEHITSKSLSEWFLEKNILVTPGTVFGPDGNPYVRLVYCLTDENIDKVCKNIIK